MQENIFQNDVYTTIKFIFKFKYNLNKNITIAIKGNEPENVVCKIAAISCRPPHVNCG